MVRMVEKGWIVFEEVVKAEIFHVFGTERWSSSNDNGGSEGSGGGSSNNGSGGGGGDKGGGS